MSRTTAPLLSFEARGQLGQTLVYSSWKGRPYARRYTVPANPKTAAQMLTREAFRGLNRIWAYLPAGALGAWELYAENSRITGRNGFLKQNVSQLREATSLATMLLSPSAGGGLVAADATFTPGVDSVTIALTAPTLPTGWTIAAAHAVALADHDPHDDVTPEIVTGTDASDPYEITLTGMATVGAYVAGAWFEYVKADGSAAYGAATQDVVTPT